MNQLISKNQVRDYNKRMTMVESVLKDANLQPSNRQIGCAVAMIMHQSKRVFLTVPSGKGKLRIIAALIALSTLARKEIKHFTIVFTSALLMSVDEQTYKDMGTILDVTVNMIVYDPHQTLDAQIANEDSAVLLDEADHVLLDNAATLTN